MESSRLQSRLPRKPRSSSSALIFATLIILCLLIGGGIAIRELSLKLPPITASTDGVARGALLQATEPTTSPADDDWERVEQTYRTSPPELGIVALQDFINDPAHANYTSAAQSQIDEALDQLWWIRIKGLCDIRDDLLKQVVAIDKEIEIVKKNGAVEERLAELKEQRTPLVKELELAYDRLKELKYTDPRVPDPYDAAMIDDLRKSRDADAFAKWKKMTANSIARNRGRLPW